MVSSRKFSGIRFPINAPSFFNFFVFNFFLHGHTDGTIMQTMFRGPQKHSEYKNMNNRSFVLRTIGRFGENNRIAKKEQWERKLGARTGIYPLSVPNVPQSEVHKLLKALNSL